MNHTRQATEQLARIREVLEEYGFDLPDLTGFVMPGKDGDTLYTSPAERLRKALAAASMNGEAVLDDELAPNSAREGSRPSPWVTPRSLSDILTKLRASFDELPDHIRNRATQPEIAGKKAWTRRTREKRILDRETRRAARRLHRHLEKHGIFVSSIMIKLDREPGESPD